AAAIIGLHRLGLWPHRLLLARPAGLFLGRTLRFLGLLFRGHESLADESSCWIPLNANRGPSTRLTRSASRQAVRQWQIDRCFRACSMDTTGRAERKQSAALNVRKSAVSGLRKPTRNRTIIMRRRQLLIILVGS